MEKDREKLAAESARLGVEKLGGYRHGIQAQGLPPTPPGRLQAETPLTAHCLPLHTHTVTTPTAPIFFFFFSVHLPHLPSGRGGEGLGEKGRTMHIKQ